MSALVAVSGLLVFACTLQEVDPLLGVDVGAPHAASLVARDGKGSFIGWLEVDGAVEVYKDANGVITLQGRFTDSQNEIWAVVRPTPLDGDFTMEWLMDGTLAKDGRKTAVVWSKGQCERLAAESTKS